jgi:hypothetical protein
MKAIVVTDQAAGTAGMKLVERPEPQGEFTLAVLKISSLIKETQTLITPGTVKFSPTDRGGGSAASHYCQSKSTLDPDSIKSLTFGQAHPSQALDAAFGGLFARRQRPISDRHRAARALRGRLVAP